MRVAIYVRVSTHGQTTENQSRELLMVAQQRDWILTHTFSDEGISGSKGRDKRPGYNAMLAAATRGEFDLLAAWSVDRLGRSVLHLAQLVEDLRAMNVGLYLHKQAIDSTTSTGRAMLGMCSVFAELEREIIRERTIAGQQRARAAGKHCGRPTRITAAIIAQVMNHYVPNICGYERTARKLNLSPSTVQRIVEHQRM